jgi:hypothetical protein
VAWLKKTFKNPIPIFESKSRSNNTVNRKKENNKFALNFIKKAGL